MSGKILAARDFGTVAALGRRLGVATRAHSAAPRCAAEVYALLFWSGTRCVRILYDLHRRCLSSRTYTRGGLQVSQVHLL